jgi:hypothetical protein
MCIITAAAINFLYLLGHSRYKIFTLFKHMFNFVHNHKGSPHFIDDILIQSSSYIQVNIATVSCNINYHY